MIVLLLTRIVFGLAAAHFGLDPDTLVFFGRLVADHEREEPPAVGIAAHGLAQMEHLAELGAVVRARLLPQLVAFEHERAALAEAGRRYLRAHLLVVERGPFAAQFRPAFSVNVAPSGRIDLERVLFALLFPFIISYKTKNVC